MDLIPAYDEQDMPSAIKQALSKYYCVVPALPDLPNPHKGRVYEKFYLLDKCIFVPKEQAEGRKCGGLQLFRNIQLITNETSFCDKYQGMFGNNVPCKVNIFQTFRQLYWSTDFIHS